MRVPVEQDGIDGKIAETLNEIIELNEKMAREFGRIGNAVGKEGRNNQRASLGNHGGGWAACVDSMNGLIGDVVQPSTEIARVIGAVLRVTSPRPWDSKWKGARSRANSCARRLINDILDLTKIESGTMAVNRNFRLGAHRSGGTPVLPVV